MRNVPDQFVEEIKTQILCSFLHCKSCPLWGNVEKYGTARQAADGNIIGRMRSAFCVNKARMWTLTNNVQYILILHCNNGYANAPLCYVMMKKTFLFFFLLYHNISNCNNTEIWTVLTVVCISEVLCFCYHWLCSADIAVGLLVWCLKDNRMNRLTVKVWQLLRRFSQNGRLLDSFSLNLP